VLLFSGSRMSTGSSCLLLNLLGRLRSTSRGEFGVIARQVEDLRTCQHIVTLNVKRAKRKCERDEKEEYTDI
jgi:hypothetical protein